MSASLIQATRQIITLFQETWAENQAYRAKNSIEAAGRTADWQECLEAAETQARELFEPLYSAMEQEHTILPVLQQLGERLKAMNQEHRSAG
jgi:hypothetical protein